ncbi:hypothetical protein GCM10010103_65010 [Streptomyces paradoxus]|uniref:Uncharacterized protein n=1 Tax=Streptomyces paradoxus TaxID=66375 RepID=A0A7W9TJL7_9ACTN|nr:hypothetical protein [Streptomyces paradoxus]MBB6081088.1 hypothetical protein [Streptomyces paradoxus]
MSETITEDLRSFVSFALAMKPEIRFQRQQDDVGPALTMTISAEESESAGEAENEAWYASLEPLMEKYQPLRPILQSVIDSKESITTCTPITSFKPGMEYRLVRISQTQFEVAQEVASKLDLIQVLREGGYSAEAGQEFDRLQDYLAEKRQLLIGDFKGIKFSDAVATYGADRLASADADCSGAVIFVLAEAFICL